MSDESTVMRMAGLRVIECHYMTEAGAPIQILRSWRDRWFSLPWQPWKRTRTHVPQVPSRQVYQTKDAIIGHPVTLRAIVAEVQRTEPKEGGE
jgi:hypothetical protein